MANRLNPFQAADRAALLGCKVWDFSWRSLGREYGRAFAGKIALRYPLRTLSGLPAYRRFVRETVPGQEIVPVPAAARADFPGLATGDGEKLLVALGFCQKPLAEDGGADCPAGRANHRCNYLARLDGGGPGAKLHPACAVCDIRLAGEKALRAGATMYVMTSALDIAHDIFLPTLARRRFRRVLMTICPYSVHPIALSLLICELSGILFTFGTGACDNYERWLRADEGYKPERTFPAQDTRAAFLALLDEVALARDNPAQRFRQEHNLYAPI
jgi:hypothetical protein